MASLRLRSPPFRSALLAALVLASLAPSAGPAAAQGPLSCLNCDFEIVTVEWNGSAEPGESTGGTFEVRNTGESTDRYTITVTADDTDWIVETEPTETGDVPPGSGLFAQEDNAVRFEVRVLPPADAPANNKTTLTIQVESQNAEDLEPQATTVEARAKQVYGWSLECTPTVTGQKTKRTEVLLNATNTGNGQDRADMSYTPIEGIIIEEPARFDAAAGETVRQTLDVGIGLRAEDGDYRIRWDLRSTGDPDTRASCTTTFEVSGGTADGDGEGGENGESPAPSFLIALVALFAAAYHRRARSG